MPLTAENERLRAALEAINHDIASAALVKGRSWKLIACDFIDVTRAELKSKEKT